jgi:prepilin signal peptidase PulO-like enzyme (type II secretory pathway)
LFENAISVYGKKFLSIALIFNSLLTTVYAIGLLAGVYSDHWQLYLPYLVNGSLFWAAIIVSIINIFPAMKFGRVKTGRLWFHHYVYGSAVMVLAVAYLKVFTSVSFLSLFTANITSLTVNVGRFFFLGGLTLVIDDFTDISKRLRSIVNTAKSKVYQRRQIIHITQYLLGLLSLYVFLCVSIYVTQNPQWATLANFILMGSLLVTTLTALVSFRRKIWLNLS